MNNHCTPLTLFRFLSSDFIEDIFERSVEKARSMDVDEVARIAGLIQDAIEKFEKIN